MTSLQIPYAIFNNLAQNSQAAWIPEDHDDPSIEIKRKRSQVSNSGCWMELKSFKKGDSEATTLSFFSSKGDIGDPSKQIFEYGVFPPRDEQTEGLDSQGFSREMHLNIIGSHSVTGVRVNLLRRFFKILDKIPD
jgi:hypothetical protein